MSKLFVLVHGSWHGGWAWDEVIRHLSKDGHQAHAPTLPGHGPGEIRAGITHEKCVDAVGAYIQHHGFEKITLVGHSFGGTVVQKVAERLPDRIARTVFLDALILADNQSVFDNLPTDYVTTFRALAAESSDNTVTIPWEIWRDNFIQDAPETMARALWKRLSPEPNQVNLEKLDLKQFHSLDLPKSVIHCRHDKALPQGYFHPACRLASELTNCLRWMAAMRSCLHGLKSWQTRLFKQAQTNRGLRRDRIARDLYKPDATRAYVVACTSISRHL